MNTLDKIAATLDRAHLDDWVSLAVVAIGAVFVFIAWCVL